MKKGIKVNTYMRIGILIIGKAKYTPNFLKKVYDLEDCKHEIKFYPIKDIEEDEKNRELSFNMRNTLGTALSECDLIGTYADIFTDIKNYIDNEVLRKKYSEKFIEI